MSPHEKQFPISNSMNINFKQMSRMALYLVFIMLAFSHKAWPQGIVSSPPSHDFSISFNNPSPSSIYTPNGQADISNNVFIISIGLGTTAATDGWITSMATNGSLTPIFPLVMQASK
jgi:hypothetical protein